MSFDATITSAANPRIKAMRKLHGKKYRNADNVFLVEGVRAIQAGCDAGHTLITLAFDVAARAEHAGLNHLLVEATARPGVDLLPTETHVLSQLSGRDNPHHAVAVFQQTWQPLEAITLTPDSTWIALDAPRDPGNLGSIIRTCDAAGADGVILLNDSCDPFAPETFRATTGALFDVALVKSDTNAFLAWARQQPVSLIGTTLEQAVDYRQCDAARASIVLMGTEQSGLSTELLDACDQRVRIPMRGKTNSLNLAVASGVMLYEMTNRKRA